jgi:hypothetical protein
MPIHKEVYRLRFIDGSGEDCTLAVSAPPAPTVTQGLIQGLELKVSYSVRALSTKATSNEDLYWTTRTERFDALVTRKTMRNPTKLRDKLLAQARNHFKLSYGRPGANPHYFALPESITITRVEVMGLVEYRDLPDQPDLG